MNGDTVKPHRKEVRIAKSTQPNTTAERRQNSDADDDDWHPHAEQPFGNTGDDDRRRPAQRLVGDSFGWCVF